MSPKIVDKDEKRYRIIEAAVRVFAKMGFPNTRMLQIAEAAGIGKGTIYEYFKSKEDLFQAVMNAYIQEIDAKIGKQVHKVDDPAQKLRIYFEEWGEILEGEFLEFAEIALDFWAEGLRKSEAGKGLDLGKMYQNYRVQIIEILDDGVKHGVFKSMDTTITASIIIGTVDGLMIQWIMDRDLYQIRPALNQLADIIIDGLTQGS